MPLLRSRRTGRCVCGMERCTERGAHTRMVRVRSQAEGRPAMHRDRLAGGWG